MREDGPSAPSAVVVHVCTACGETDDATGPAPGRNLFDRLAGHCRGDRRIAVHPVDCLAVCERPVTIAFQAPGKWSYTIGDIDPDGTPLADIAAAARAVADSPSGVPKMSDRPPFFRRGVIARLPAPPERETMEPPA